MRFHPRYSLLTLLVLTALVAGGVKQLWHGPHEMQLIVLDAFGEATQAKRTPEEQQLVQQLPIYGDVCANDHYEYHLRYFNELRGRVFTTGKGIILTPSYLTSNVHGPEVLPGQYFSKGLQLEYRNEQNFREQIACFIFEVNQQSKGVFRGHYWIKTPELFAKAKIPVPIYFITTSKRVFQLEQQGSDERTVRLVTPNQITEPALAARVAEELAAMK